MADKRDGRIHVTGDALYRSWLSEVIESGRAVASVSDPLSAASGFGAADRPYLELIATQRTLGDPHRCLIAGARPPLNLPYCFAYAAWFLAGRNDVETLAFYRPAARNFSDDGATLCGSFGHRLFQAGPGNQVSALVQRARSDPSSRRLFAPIVSATDNLEPSREYPCAAGYQFFVRDGCVHGLTIMRAQHAMTILPYDLFIFALLTMSVASELGIPVGAHTHFAGTLHIYENERADAEQITASNNASIVYPPLPRLPARMLTKGCARLVDVEEAIRQACQGDDARGLHRIASKVEQHEFTSLAKAALLLHAASELRLPDSLWADHCPTEAWRVALGSAHDDQAASSNPSG